jgi:cell division protein FtsW
MIEMARTDRSIVTRWWWTVDRWMLAALFLLGGIGAILVMAASPAVADRLDLDSFHFVQRQFPILAVSLSAMVVVSLASPLWVRRGGFAVLVGSIVLLIGVLLVGPEIKGAQRWIPMGFLLLQPSEFVKPALAIFTAWMLAERARNPEVPGHMISVGMLALVIGLLALQPDIGMVLLVTMVWFLQAFIAGMKMRWVAGLGIAGAGMSFGAYAIFPHVASRVNRFLDPSSGDTYQVETALNAFGNGGLFGVGPGEGVVKNILPDAHADFIFAVAGEELGMLVTVGIVALFGFVVLRALLRLAKEGDMFVLLAASGLASQFGIQAAINMGVNMRLLPAKGMTLPFVSYGGSSLLALALGMGALLALTRARAGRNAAPTNALRSLHETRVDRETDIHSPSGAPSGMRS